MDGNKSRGRHDGLQEFYASPYYRHETSVKPTRSNTPICCNQQTLRGKSPLLNTLRNSKACRSMTKCKQTKMVTDSKGITCFGTDYSTTTSSKILAVNSKVLGSPTLAVSLKPLEDFFCAQLQHNQLAKKRINAIVGKISVNKLNKHGRSKPLGYSISQGECVHGKVAKQRVSGPNKQTGNDVTTHSRLSKHTKPVSKRRYHSQSRIKKNLSDDVKRRQVSGVSRPSVDTMRSGVNRYSKVTASVFKSYQVPTPVIKSSQVPTPVIRFSGTRTQLKNSKYTGATPNQSAYTASASNHNNTRVRRHTNRKSTAKFSEQDSTTEECMQQLVYALRSVTGENQSNTEILEPCVGQYSPNKPSIRLMGQCTTDTLRLDKSYSSEASTNVFVVSSPYRVSAGSSLMAQLDHAVDKCTSLKNARVMQEDKTDHSSKGLHEHLVSNPSPIQPIEKEGSIKGSYDSTPGIEYGYTCQSNTVTLSTVDTNQTDDSGTGRVNQQLADSQLLTNRVESPMPVGLPSEKACPCSYGGRIVSELMNGENTNGSCTKSSRPCLSPANPHSQSATKSRGSSVYQPNSMNSASLTKSTTLSSVSLKNSLSHKDSGLPPTITRPSTSLFGTSSSQTPHPCPTESPPYADSEMYKRSGSTSDVADVIIHRTQSCCIVDWLPNRPTAPIHKLNKPSADVRITYRPDAMRADPREIVIDNTHGSQLASTNCSGKSILPSVVEQLKDEKFGSRLPPSHENNEPSYNLPRHAIGHKTHHPSQDDTSNATLASKLRNGPTSQLMGSLNPTTWDYDNGITESSTPNIKESSIAYQLTQSNVSCVRKISEKLCYVEIHVLKELRAVEAKRSLISTCTLLNSVSRAYIETLTLPDACGPPTPTSASKVENTANRRCEVLSPWNLKGYSLVTNKQSQSMRESENRTTPWAIDSTGIEYSAVMMESDQLPTSSRKALHTMSTDSNAAEKSVSYGDLADSESNVVIADVSISRNNSVDLPSRGWQEGGLRDAEYDSDSTFNSVSNVQEETSKYVPAADVSSNFVNTEGRIIEGLSLRTPPKEQQWSQTTDRISSYSTSKYFSILADVALHSEQFSSMVTPSCKTERR